MDSLVLQSPAKINLMLSVHGRRADGFHRLSSIVAPLAFGDTLHVSAIQASADTLECDRKDVPDGPSNLVLRAAAAFRARTGRSTFFSFRLEKRIPIGAGLGGGSGNAAVALRAMNTLTGENLGRSDLIELAAQCGSDCPFFIDSRVAEMSGRGEELSPLSEHLTSALSGQKIFLFKQSFS